MLRRFLAAALFVALARGVASAAATVPVEAGSLDGVQDLGSAPASVTVHVAVVLNYHHEAELDRLIEAQADPSSRLYHRFLSAAEFRGYFAPTPAEYRRVVAALQRGGFTITHTFANDTVVDVSAPAPVAARYFATDIHSVVSPETGVTYANVRAGAVPAALADATRGVFGLDATQAMHAQPLSLPAGAPRPIRRSVRRNGVPLFGPDGGYGPQIFINAYDLPAATGNTGTGRASGVDMDGDFLDSDLAAYLTYFGITRTGPATTRVPIDGGAPKFPNGDAQETTLDVETIVSLAPGTALYVYELPSYNSLAQYITDTYNTVVSDDVVDTLNSSWYGCERHDRQLWKALDAIEKQGSAEGITFHGITGDRGPYGRGSCLKNVSVNIPGSTPHDIDVGGTTLGVDANGSETSEVGWNEPGSGATGGGVSVVFGLPSYQKNVPNVIAGGRNVPDLAFDADPYTGTSFYFNGKWQGPNGGTSMSSPIFGAALAEINELQNSRSGLFNVTLYKTWLANGYGSPSALYFRDITQGSIPPYFAQPGYDQMSGIGTMQVSNFAGLLPK